MLGVGVSEIRDHHEKLALAQGIWRGFGPLALPAQEKFGVWGVKLLGRVFGNHLCGANESGRANCGAK